MELLDRIREVIARHRRMIRGAEELMNLGLEPIDVEEQRVALAMLCEWEQMIVEVLEETSNG